MTMPMVLQYAQEWFRDKYLWKPNQCGVQHQAQPAYDAGSFYVAIDDAGVRAGEEETESLLEICSITVGIWRRKEHFTQSQIGNLKLEEDKYLVGAYTTAKLERCVLVNNFHGQGNLYGLHKGYDFMNGLNARFDLPNEEDGGGFTKPFVYGGRGPMESITISHKNGDGTWFGYRLSFRGLRREQGLHSTTYGLG